VTITRNKGSFFSLGGGRPAIRRHAMAKFFSTTLAPTVDDMSCFTVDDTSFDYDYELLGSITNATQCNCSIALHAYLEPCFDVCDYPEAPLPPIEEVLVPGFVYALVFLVGTIGNGLVIFVVNRFRRMRNVTNVFLASLSTADLCLIWLCVPIMVSPVSLQQIA
jgi:7 transmembrane receptor (rhodopsin family)